MPLPWHRDTDVIAFAMKDRMLSGADDYIEVARRPPVHSGIALAREADALAVARARLDANFQRFGALHGAFPVAHRTG
jgi:hypothetical protein